MDPLPPFLPYLVDSQDGLASLQGAAATPPAHIARTIQAAARCDIENEGARRGLQRLEGLAEGLVVG